MKRIGTIVAVEKGQQGNVEGRKRLQIWEKEVLKTMEKMSRGGGQTREGSCPQGPPVAGRPPPHP
jgi:hypothetical protein